MSECSPARSQRGHAPAGSQRGHAPAGSQREHAPAASQREHAPAASQRERGSQRERAPPAAAPPMSQPPSAVPMTESELAEGAYNAAEALQLDPTDPASFVKAESALQAALHGFTMANFDVEAVGRFLAALKVAASNRGVPPAQLWSALYALESN